jgi:hypothetical protein
MRTLHVEQAAVQRNNLNTHISEVPLQQINVKRCAGFELGFQSDADLSLLLILILSLSLSLFPPPHLIKPLKTFQH